jgi:hypothetical protein
MRRTIATIVPDRRTAAMWVAAAIAAAGMVGGAFNAHVLSILPPLQ